MAGDRRGGRAIADAGAGFGRLGRYVYAAVQVRGGVDVIDITDPQKPALAGHVGLSRLPPDFRFTYPFETTLVPAGTLLFHTAATSLIILDAVNPTRPRLVSRIDF